MQHIIYWRHPYQNAVKVVRSALTYVWYENSEAISFWQIPNKKDHIEGYSLVSRKRN